MATVAEIIHAYLQQHQKHIVYFEGNTSAKNKLYNRIIKNNYDFFTEFYEIRGKINIEGETQEIYSPQNQYYGFYIYKKGKMPQKIVFTPELIQTMTTKLKDCQIVKDKLERARLALSQDIEMQEFIKNRNLAS